jgi:hypothetical protein
MNDQQQDLYDRAAEAMDALYELQLTDLWECIPIETRRYICAARTHCEALTDALEGL